MKRFLVSVISIVFLTAGSVGTAALPSVVDGQPLPSLAPMLQQVIPGVVNIATEGRVQMRDPFFDDPIFRKFFGLPDTPPSRRSQSLGSGVIVDAKKGYVLTNNHVIDRAEKITVTLKDGRSFTATQVGTDPESDIAVIQIPAENLQALPMADSEQLQVGDFVVAIGSPFGLGQTVTSGIVSALGRSGLGIEGYEDFIQTDASINPGNSGGALVNLRGELIGINTAILSRTGGNIGIGFAIPINMADTVMQQLIQYGEVKRGLLGVNIQDLTPELAKAFDIDARTGAVITQVAPGSSAEKAGLQSGDVVVSVDGRPVRNAAHMRNMIGLLTIGQKIRLEVLRDGKKRTVAAVIGEAPTETTGDVGAEKIHPRLAGSALGNIQEGSPLFGRVEGVQILEVQPGSPAWQAGLRPNDVIVSANRKEVKSLDDLKQAVKPNQKALLLNIRRGNGALFLLLQ